MNFQWITICITYFTLTACQAPKNQPDPATAESHNSRNSLDWAGVYRGTIPCADCQGIQTEIRLHDDLTYHRASRYLGKDTSIFRESGSFEWDQNGSKIILAISDHDSKPVSYLVGENVLIQLDMEGNRITGNLADRYLLKKDENEITEKYWKLVELYGQKVVMGENQQREVYVILKTEDNRIQGFGSCNTFSGHYQLLDGNRIRFLNVAATKMACPEMQTEVQFFEVLEKADSYHLDGDRLALHRARMAPIARFEAVYFR